jgi:hypothetical protein
MKVRSGWVSNSSSSSFIIATKGEIPHAKLKEVVAATLKVPPDSPLYYMANEMASLLAHADCYTLEQLLDEMGYDQAQDAFKYHPIISKAIKKGFDTYYYGSVSDEEGGVEDILCNIGIQYEDDTIMIDKEEGY